MLLANQGNKFVGIIMVMKKEIFLSAVAFYMLGTTVANAQMKGQLNVGVPVYAAAPAPVYFSPYPDYYDPQHRRHDFQYWQQHRGNNHHEHADNGRHEGQEHAEYEHR